MKLLDMFWDIIWAAFLDDNEWWIKAKERDPWDPIVNPAR
jgi:hypothetical protein